MTDARSVVVGAGLDGIERILLVAAHPDDAEFGAAGTVAIWTAAGIDVSYLIVTDGDAGTDDPAADRSALARLRREEQRAAAAAVGVNKVDFLGYPDGEVTASRELRRDISRAIRALRPDRLVCSSPERIWEPIGASHPDHLATGEAAVCAFYPDARNRFAHPELTVEGLEPYSVRELWLLAHPEMNRVVDVTATFERKIDALKQHQSQVGEGEWLKPRLAERLSQNAESAGLAPGSLAETFFVVISPW